MNTISTKAVSGIKGDKTRMSLLVCTNADGSDKRDLLFIGHHRAPRCFQKKTAEQWGLQYGWNKNAWMTGECSVDRQLINQRRPVRGVDS